MERGLHDVGHSVYGSGYYGMVGSILHVIAIGMCHMDGRAYHGGSLY